MKIQDFFNSFAPFLIVSIIPLISEIIKNEAKEQKGRFLPMLLGTLASSILGNELSGRGLIRGGEGVIRAGQNF